MIIAKIRSKAMYFVRNLIHEEVRITRDSDQCIWEVGAAYAAVPESRKAPRSGMGMPGEAA
jgi:hypothetical protein